MEGLYESSVLDELFDSRRIGFESMYIEKYGKGENLEKADTLYEKLANIMKNELKDGEKQEECWKLLEGFQDALIDEMNFWEEQYYKLGFCDAHSLRVETKKEKERLTFGNNDNMLHFDFNNFDSLFDIYVCNVLNNTKCYNDIMKQIRNIKDEFPKIKEFIEDGSYYTFSEKELSAILKIMSLERDLEKIETKEAFKLGLKEGNLL